MKRKRQQEAKELPRDIQEDETRQRMTRQMKDQRHPRTRSSPTQLQSNKETMQFLRFTMEENERGKVREATSGRSREIFRCSAPPSPSPAQEFNKTNTAISIEQGREIGTLLDGQLGLVDLLNLDLALLVGVLRHGNGFL